jgi:methionine synthase II (cobalamin-independent)
MWSRTFVVPGGSDAAPRLRCASMFATLLGALPRPPLPDDAPRDALVEAAVRAQEEAGLDPVTDGGPPADDDRDLARAWAATQRLSERAVKQAIAGPYTAARGDGMAPARDRTNAALDRARALNAALRELAAAGCPLIEIHEPAATAVGTDEAERALFREAHLRLLDGVEGSHLSLALTGGNADVTGIETLLAAPYASLAVDLIAGPDNWRLVVATPGDRGIVCGTLSTAPTSEDGPELLLWAAAYAASTGGRGPARVGLASASSFADLPWEVALRKLGRLGEAARLADEPLDTRMRSLDPRAVSSRSAALGRIDPRPSRGSDPGDDPT